MQYPTLMHFCHTTNIALFTYNIFLCMVESYFFIYNLKNPLISKYIAIVADQKNIKPNESGMV